jgi:hypothetical protein
MQSLLGVLACEGYQYMTNYSIYKSGKWLILHITTLQNDVIVSSKVIINEMILGPQVD